MLRIETKKHEVRRPFDTVDSVPAPFGEVEEGDFRLVRDSSGNCEYIEIGKRNVLDYVESFKTGCSLKAILDRCQLMPVRDKVVYLNQTEQGVSADMTNMPKDGTEAFLMVKKVKEFIPDYADRMRKGETFDQLLLSILPKSDDPSSVVETKKEIESEVAVNG